MKIMIFGATGTGKTTLAAEFAKQTGFKHLDSDDYYWRKTHPPFQEKVPIPERNQNIKIDFHQFENVIISGSMVSWGESWKKAFDLVVFLILENSKRLARLKQREIERYGDKLLTDSTIRQTSKEFLNWANQYENLDFNGTTIQTHINWLQQIDSKILQLNGADQLHYNVQVIINEM